MPKLDTTVVATTTQVVKLKPTVRVKLVRELRAYAALRAQKEAIEHAMDAHKTKIGALREETGEGSIALEGFRVTQVCGQRSVLNKMKLVELGCALSWIEEATETKSNRPYTKITVPGEKDSDDA